MFIGIFVNWCRSIVRKLKLENLIFFGSGLNWDFLGSWGEFVWFVRVGWDEKDCGGGFLKMGIFFLVLIL